MDPTPVRPVGWYSHPDQPDRIRHWSGTEWDLRSRPRPPWMGATRPFAARTPDAGLPGGAPADGRVDPRALQDLPRSMATSPARAVAGYGPVSGRHPLQRHRHPAGTGPYDHEGPTVRVLASRSHRRRPFPIMMSTLVFGALAMLVISILGTTRSPTSSVASISDPAYAHAANVDCAAAIGAVHTPDAPQASAPGSATGSTPAQVQEANVHLDDLATELAALPLDQADETLVQAWLHTWHAYGTARLDAARARGSEAATLAGTAGIDASRADTFALGNGLGDCLLGNPPGTATQF